MFGSFDSRQLDNSSLQAQPGALENQFMRLARMQGFNNPFSNSVNPAMAQARLRPQFGMMGSVFGQPQNMNAYPQQGMPPNAGSQLWFNPAAEQSSNSPQKIPPAYQPRPAPFMDPAQIQSDVQAMGQRYRENPSQNVEQQLRAQGVFQPDARMAPSFASTSPQQSPTQEEMLRRLMSRFQGGM